MFTYKCIRNVCSLVDEIKAGKTFFNRMVKVFGINLVSIFSKDTGLQFAINLLSLSFFTISLIIAKFYLHRTVSIEVYLCYIPVPVIFLIYCFLNKLFFRAKSYLKHF